MSKVLDWDDSQFGKEVYQERPLNLLMICLQ